jgi:hypothetical protein
MAGYTRNDTLNNIADGNIINAADLDGEFDALVAAFHASTGHVHDGTAANGAPITKTGPAQEFIAVVLHLHPRQMTLTILVAQHSNLKICTLMALLM